MLWQAAMSSALVKRQDRTVHRWGLTIKTNLALGVSLLSRLAAKGKQAVRGQASNAIHCRHMYSSQVVKVGTEACSSIGSTTGRCL